ncbi:CapA family protein [Leptolyngbya iicbica]|uniref:CapA family protein n=2 Tax=Cyanophyceae TaxID=3028117 RepID=A0A4Q7E609_9CYAN|nr:CapA family protein [Leptolyngbya sp. LK]RZM77701.1 CapA family protein [Leptolyngbya sp. LK]
MVNATVNSSADSLSTKVLAAAGQFRAIALWLNEPLIPEGIYAQVSQDKRPGCIQITLEFERTPLQKPLTQYVCHLIWQLNSPLIEGIHLTARPIGGRKLLWQQRIRVMTPALRERLKREQGAGATSAMIPPTLVQRTASTPNIPGFGWPVLADQIKTMRAFMLTGSAVAAFVFGCMVEVVMSGRTEPSLPFQTRAETEAGDRLLPAGREARNKGAEPQLPTFTPNGTHTVLADHAAPDQATSHATTVATSVAYKVEPERDRPNVVNAALEPVGVLKHDRLELPQDPTITLLFGGDVDLDGLPYDQLAYEGQLLAGLPNYRQADIAMVNLQDPLASSATSLEEEWLERQRPDAINLLKEGGVDLVNLTGKQALAFGEQGLAETLDTLDRNGVFRVGAGRGQREARRPEIVDVKGQRIAYLSYDRDFTLAADETLGGVNAVTMKEIVADIQAIRDEVDWLVVSYRWSTEPPATPAESQTNLARLAIDQGADLVVGQHPHQLQGAELYKGRPIAYSLGDFVYTQATENPTAETAVLQVAIRAGQMKVDLIPVKVENGQPQKVSGAEGDRILQKIYAASQEFREPMPPSVVLDVRPTGAGAAPVTPDGDGFTVDEPLETTPQFAPEPEPTGEAEVAPPDAFDETAPVEPAPTFEAEDELDIEIEEFSDDLLQEWGPKDSPNTIYEPESRLPSEFKQPVEKPQPSTPTDIDKLELQEVEISNPAPDDKPAAQPKSLESPPAIAPAAPPPAPKDAIGPYSEPLVGPMSSLPEITPEMKLMQHKPMDTDVNAGLPQTRVYEPLSHDDEPGDTVNIDAIQMDEIAQSDPSSSL